MITSFEFRSLMSQSARLLSEQGGDFIGSIVVNFDRGFKEVPTVMNFVSRFPVDIDPLFPDSNQSST